MGIVHVKYISIDDAFGCRSVFLCSESAVEQCLDNEGEESPATDDI